MKKLFAMLLALCMMCGAMVAGAEENVTTEVMLGNVHFQIPAELTAQEPLVANGLYLQNYDGADYSVEIVVLDYEQGEIPLTVLSGANGQINNLFLCLRLVGLDENTALTLRNNSNYLDMEMPGGGQIVYFGLDGIGAAAYCYRDVGCLVSVIAKDGSIDGARCCEIALTIASSFRLDGVTEEDMAADAEAARIAAEEAAAQKYIVIKNGTANIRSGPGSDHDRITTAKQGDTFPLLGEEGTWYMIEVNGQTAYVSKGLCEIEE